ncbi:hypothetical protein Tco_0981584, partial [Tanacetum coccineum]
NQMITYLKHVANKKHAELKSKSFEEIQVLAIGSEEDERAIKKINEKDADKEEEKKDESEGAKKRKLGTRRKLKAKRRKHGSSLTREDDDLKICLHIAPDEDKVIDVESLDCNILLRKEQSSYMTQLLPKGSFLQNKGVLLSETSHQQYERYKKQDQTFVAIGSKEDDRYKKQDQTFVAIGSEEDERAIKKMNEKDADKEEEKKDESVHEEVQEEGGAKKRKLGTRRKLKAKRRKHG